MNESEFNSTPLKERMSRVLNGTGYFMSVHTPNYAGQRQFNAPPEFVVSLVPENEEEMAKAKSFGLRVFEATNDIPAPYVKIKRKVKDDKDPEEVKPDVVDSMQKDIPESILLGNGSKVAVKFSTYWHQKAPEYGVGTTLFKVMVKDLVPYEGGRIDRDLGTDESGFSIEEHMSLELYLENEAPTTSQETGNTRSALDDIFDED